MDKTVPAGADVLCDFTRSKPTERLMQGRDSYCLHKGFSVQFKFNVQISGRAYYCKQLCLICSVKEEMNGTCW
jgi:hypothetical protein